MPQIINPIAVDNEPLDAELLKQFLLDHIAKGELSWSAGCDYPSPPTFSKQTPQFKLSFSLLLRPRNDSHPSKPGYRIEIFKEELIGSGSYGTIFESRGTISLTEESIAVHLKKPRVLKFFKHYDPDQETIVTRVRHLHAKRTVKLGTNRYVQVMKKFKGINLRQFLAQFNRSNPITVEQCFQLTLSLLRAYEEQVAAYGLIHRDIRPENIMIDDIESMFIIDYDTACLISGPTSRSTPSPVSGLTSPLKSPLFEIFEITPKFEKYVERVMLLEKRKEEFIGTLGYIPMEGYLVNQPHSAQYDYYALAQVISEIWQISKKQYQKLDFNSAKIEASNTCFLGRLDPILLPNAEIREKIEFMLTQLSHFNPNERPCIADVIESFKQLRSMSHRQKEDMVQDQPNSPCAPVF